MPHSWEIMVQTNMLGELWKILSDIQVSQNPETQCSFKRKKRKVMLQQCRCFAMDLFCVFSKAKLKDRANKSRKDSSNMAPTTIWAEMKTVLYTQKLPFLNLSWDLGESAKEIKTKALMETVQKTSCWLCNVYSVVKIKLWSARSLMINMPHAQSSTWLLLACIGNGWNEWSWDVGNIKKIVRTLSRKQQNLGSCSTLRSAAHFSFLIQSEL